MFFKSIKNEPDWGADDLGESEQESGQQAQESGQLAQDSSQQVKNENQQKTSAKCNSQQTFHKLIAL